MSEILSYIGRQRERLGRRIMSFFGVVPEQHTDSSGWKNKLENQNEVNTCGVEIRSILPDDRSVDRHFLDDMQEMLNIVGKEDEDIISAKELLRKEFESFSDMHDPELRDLLRKYSENTLSDQNANGDTEDLNGELNPLVHTTTVDANRTGCCFHEGVNQRTRKEHEVNFKLATSAESKNTDENRSQSGKWSENSNNCAREQDALDTAINVAENTVNSNTSNLLAPQVSVSGGSKFNSNPTFITCNVKTHDNKRKQKRHFSNKYTSPKLNYKRRASSLDALNRLTDIRCGGSSHFDDLLSEAELARSKITPRSENLDGAKTLPNMARSYERELDGVKSTQFGIISAAKNKVSGKLKRTESFLIRKLKLLFSSAKEHEAENDAECSVSTEDGTCSDFMPARRTAGAETLPIVDSNQLTGHALDSDADLNKTWWEFLDVISTGSSDICTWEELMQMADKKQSSEDLGILNNDDSKTADWTTAEDRLSERQKLSSLGQVSKKIISPRKQTRPKKKKRNLYTKHDRGDSAEESHLLCKATRPLRPRDTATGQNTEDTADSQFPTRSWSASDLSLDSSVLAQSSELLSRNINVSMSKSQENRASKYRIVRFRASKIPVRHLSAPELRHRMGLEREPRSLSMHDLPISHRCDIAGGYPLELCSKADAPALLFGEAAYKHYQLLMMIETKQKIQKIKDAKHSIIQKYLAKQRALEHIVKVAKAYYSDPTGKHREEWKKLRKEIDQSSVHSITDIRHKLAQIPEYLPYFTTFVIMVQVVWLSAMCAFGGLAPMGVLSSKELKREVQTFLGAETFHKWVTPNPWIGPPISTILAAGASLAPCMRHDRYIREYSNLQQYFKLDNTSFGCCQMAGPINAAGTTTKWECTQWTSGAGRWAGPHCSKRAPGQNSIAHVIRPCCVDHKGTCKMLSHEHCNFLQGKFHPDIEHCVEVNCIQEACRIGSKLYSIHSDPERPWLPASDDNLQWWRLLLSLMLTFGILHCLPLVAIEWLLMRPLETSAGWLRIIVIYCICGVAGQIVAGIAQPYVPHVGSTSAVAGMVGEAAVELRQAWHLLNKPLMEALKLAAFFSLLLFMGLLPYVSLLGTLTGVMCGALCALVMMPYITFDSYAKKRRVQLGSVGVILLLGFNIAVFFVYVQLQPQPCEACRTIDCLSFAENICTDWDLYG